MNFGAQGVMARETMDEIGRSYSYVQENGPLCGKMFGWLTDEMSSTRMAFAEEFSCTAQNIALTQSTTDGCNIVLWGLPWKSGETLVITDAEHSGVVAAAAQLARRHHLNLSICPVASQSDLQILDWLDKNLDSKTRLFVFSHILWTNGKALPVREMVDLCHRRQVLALVDGAQSAGVLDLNIPDTAADFYAVTGHKWLGGPEGVGALYVAEDAVEKLEPTFVGWRSCKFDKHGNPSGWEAGATRYEVATAAVPLLSAMRKSLSLRRLHGTAAERYQLVLAHALKLRNALDLKQINYLSPQSPLSGLVSFTVEGASHSRLCAQLEAENIIVRTLSSPDCIRASVHYFTSDDDISKLAAAIASAVQP
jgi:L-cysteine/cystine lyase